MKQSNSLNAILTTSNSQLEKLIIITVTLCFVAGCNRQAFIQNAVSMRPTIQLNEKVNVDKAAYTSKQPQRWDVILFRPPQKFEGVWTFRIVGMPGETVSFSESGLLIDGRAPAVPPSLAHLKYTSAPQTQPPSPLLPFTIPADSYFVLGDDSSIANDSRMWGPVKKNQIIGKVLDK
jgi:signal peptidase I